MPSRGRTVAWLLGAILAGPLTTPASGGAPAAAPAGLPRCRVAVVEGEVHAREALRRSFGGGLDLLLEPIASGWVVRVVPTHGERPKMDYAEIATPPYRSVSPLLISTDYSFRAQDAIGWNPRRFRYAADPHAFARLQEVYGRIVAATGGQPGDEAALARMAAKQPGGSVEILDASLAPGTADATRAAALVASHFGTTAHRVEAPPGGKATPLGSIGWIRVRVKLELRGGARPTPGVRVESSVGGGS